MPEQKNQIMRVGRARQRDGGWRFLSGLLLIAALLLLGIQPVLAQNLRFSVPQSSADVYVNPDGTVTVEYLYRFENAPGADVIDFVEIGMPTRTYDINSVTATINGQPVERIAPSQFVDPGVEIHLGQNAIQPGQSGELFVHIGTVERMLFRAEVQAQEPYASFQFEPNFFGEEFVTGQTEMTVTLYLPPGMTENEPRYFTPEGWPGSEEPESGFDDQDRVFYRWSTPNASSSAIYRFGAAFPARLVPEDVLLTEVPFSGLLNTEVLCPVLFCIGFFGFVVFIIYASIVGERKRRLQYLPPRVAVEGNGIKRGLTAVEAALLMQQPMDKILTMILFSVVKKGAATVVSRNPMKLEITRPFPEDLRSYEVAFLEAMELERPAQQRQALQNMMTALVRSVSEKMRGFSRRETEAYYREIMNKAWQQVEQAQTPEMKMQMFDEAMDWTMLDRRFDDRTREVFGPRPVILPGWWGRYDPTLGRGTAGGQAAPRPSVPSAGNRPPEGVNLPNLPGGDFAASMVGGMQSFAANVIGDLTSFTGGVTEKTNPVPKPTSTGGRRGGGGGGGRSCACACACAGCACACAGGGR